MIINMKKIKLTEIRINQELIVRRFQTGLRLMIPQIAILIEIINKIVNISNLVKITFTNRDTITKGLLTINIKMAHKSLLKKEKPST